MTDRDELNQILFALLSNFNVPFDMKEFDGHVLYTVEKFGVRIVFVEGDVNKKKLRNWIPVYVYPDFSSTETRDKILWGLAKGGYLHYIKHNFKNTFNSFLHQENFHKKLVEEREKRYRGKPKYNYFMELNDLYKKEPSNYIMSIDPGFYEFLVEISE
jgi:hypothetical protein